MSHKTVEVKISEEVYALVKKMAEHGRGKGRGEPVPCTIGEMAGDLVSTGAYRRIAANKWAKEHAKPAKPRKVKAKTAKKSSSKKPAAKKAKAPKKAAKKSSSKKKSAAPASSSASAPASASVLD